MRSLKFQPLHVDETDTPEITLITQVLSYAIRDLLNYGHNYDIERADHKNAEAWIESSRKDEFSFIWICQHLGLDANRVRSLLLQHSDNGIVWEVAA